MIRFKKFITEGRYPAWTKAVTVGLVLRVRNLASAIEREQDPVKQNKLIAQQNKLLAYLDGLGIAVNSDDPRLMASVRSKVG
jgi:hypothetical protein